MGSTLPLTHSVLFRHIARALPWGISGVDSDGDPVIVVCVGRMCLRSLRASGCTDEVFDDFATCMIIFMYDHYLPREFPDSKVINMIIDVSGISSEHVSLAKYTAMHCGIMHYNRYPGKHKRVIIANANMLFRAAWKVLKFTLVAKEVRDRVEIVKSPAHLLPVDCVPVFLGGKSLDSRIFKPSACMEDFWEFINKRERS